MLPRHIDSGPKMVVHRYERKPGDDLLSKDARLKYKWNWSRIASGYSSSELSEWTHFQCSEAKIGLWTLETTQWGGDLIYYESSIRYRDLPIASVGGNERTGTKTRIEAQINAEELLMTWITEEYKHISETK